MPNIIEITDFSAPELDIYARLTENQLVNRADPAHAMFIAESPVVIGRALEAGCRPVSFLMETKHVTGKGRELIERCGDVPVYAAPLEVLTRLTGFHLTRGMLCAMRRRPAPKRAQAVIRKPQQRAEAEGQHQRLRLHGKLDLHISRKAASTATRAAPARHSLARGRGPAPRADPAQGLSGLYAARRRGW